MMVTCGGTVGVVTEPGKVDERRRAFIDVVTAELGKPLTEAQRALLAELREHVETLRRRAGE